MNNDQPVGQKVFKINSFCMFGILTFLGQKLSVHYNQDQVDEN